MFDRGGERLFEIHKDINKSFYSVIVKSPSTIGDVGSELNTTRVVLKEVESKPR